MRVVLATWTRFHVFYLARQLERFGWLTGVFSTYPRMLLRSEGIDPQKLYCNPWLLAPLMLKQRLGLHNQAVDRMWTRAMDNHHNRYIARRVPECDFFIALSGAGLIGGRVVQSRGGQWFCNRSSSHILYSQKLLSEEYARYGEEFPQADPELLEKELREYEESDLVIVPSEYARDTFVEMGIAPSRVVKVSFGGDLNRFQRTAEPDPDQFTVFYCGQVSFRKGIPYLLEAFRRLKHPRKRLVIAGGVHPQFKSYLAKQDLENVELVGILGPRQLSDFYSRAHVFAIASLDEGMAKVQTEAMSVGTPVIATPNAGATGVIREGVDGFIVPIRDPQAMADRMQQLADQPELRATMGANAKDRIQSLGGWDHYGDEYKKLLLSRKGMVASQDFAAS